MFKRNVIVLAVAAIVLVGFFWRLERPDGHHKTEARDSAPEQLQAEKRAQVGEKEKEALNEQLSQAIEAKDLEKVKVLLAAGADLNVCDKAGQLPLEVAAETGSMELVGLLLKNGADLKAKNRSGRSAKDAAFAGALFRGQENTAGYFLDKGADVNAVRFDERTALQYAVNFFPDFTKTLLEKGADVNGRNGHGETALMYAARSGKVAMTRLFLEKGADVNARNAKGETALMEVGDGLASFGYLSGDTSYPDGFRKSLAILKLLLERGADVNVTDSDEQTGGSTALLRFSAAGFPEAVKLLLDKGAEVNTRLDDGSNALFWSMIGRLAQHPYPLQGMWTLERRRKVEKGLLDRRAETAKLLINHGIDVNAKLKYDGSTALIWAAFLGDVELAKLLLDKGADVDSGLTDGRTPLLCAVTGSLGTRPLKKLGSLSDATAGNQSKPQVATSLAGRQIEVAKLLLDHKADTNAKLADGATALMWASILGQTEMVKLLLEHGADADLGLSDGSTPLQWAALYDRTGVVKLLAQHGGKGALAAAASIGLRDQVLSLLDEGADVNAKDALGTTALMACSRGGNPETTGLLLDMGADVNAKDERGWTALSEAVWKGHLEVAALLLDKGADSDVGDKSGWTPLILAAWNGQSEAVKLLVERGANVNAKDAFGKTAFMRAVEMGRRDVAALLLDTGADVNAGEPDGRTAMTAAAAWQDLEMVKLLRERGASLTTAAAALLGDATEMQRLVEEAAKNGKQTHDASMALLIAAKNGREDMVKYLLDRCSEIDIKEPSCESAFLFAIQKKYSGISEALLKKGANVNAADDWERSALHYAVWKGDPKLVRKLLEKGADVNTRTILQEAPLMGAVEHENVEMVKILLENGASLSAGLNRSDLWEAAEKRGNNEILEMLKAHALKHPDQPQPPSEKDH